MGRIMTRVDEAVLKIKSMIKNEEYDENGFLLCEADLSEKLGVSRMTIREAIRTLEVRGFVKRLHGVGVKICDKSDVAMVQAMTDMFDKNDLSVEDVIELRMTIEPKAAELAAKRAGEDDIEKLCLFVEKMDKADSIDATYLNSDYEFHKTIVACTKNSMIISIVNAYSEWLQASIKGTNMVSENLEHNFNYHRKIFNAIKARDENKAKEMMIEHLEAASEMYMKTKESKFIMPQ